MIDDIRAVVPVEARPPEVERAALELPVIAQAPPSAEQVHAVDRAFTADQEKTDAIAGLMGLWLSAPWLGDLIADHFRTAPEDEPPAQNEEEPGAPGT
jgi:hypothetical protein